MDINTIDSLIEEVDYTQLLQIINKVIYQLHRSAPTKLESECIQAMDHNLRILELKA